MFRVVDGAGLVWLLCGCGTVQHCVKFIRVVVVLAPCSRTGIGLVGMLLLSRPAGLSARRALVRCFTVCGTLCFSRVRACYVDGWGCVDAGVAMWCTAGPEARRGFRRDVMNVVNGRTGHRSIFCCRVMLGRVLVVVFRSCRGDLGCVADGSVS